MASSSAETSESESESMSEPEAKSGLRAFAELASGLVEAGFGQIQIPVARLADYGAPVEAMSVVFQEKSREIRPVEKVVLHTENTDIEFQPLEALGIPQNY